MPDVVEVRGLRKDFVGGGRPGRAGRAGRGGAVHAIDGVDLATKPGEYLVLLGPSGCGKTTLLRTIAGLEEPTAGEVLIGDQVVNGLPPRARKIAMVFQSYALYPHKTVLKNITFPLKAAKMPPDKQRERVEWATGLLGIEHLLGRRPRQLSGGERQRVALARALVREPRVFLLDEPLSNLDAKLRAIARDELKRFQQRVDTTTIYVTHDQAEAMGLGDRIAVMNAGKIRQLGHPVDVYDDPADTFVATFIGSPPMNLVPRDGHLVGFRPEHLLPIENVRGAERVTMPFHIERVEYLSGDRHVYGTISGIGEDTRVIARLPSTVDTPISAGERHDFAVPSARLRFFDAESGQRSEPVPVGAAP